MLPASIITAKNHAFSLSCGLLRTAGQPVRYRWMSGDGVWVCFLHVGHPTQHSTILALAAPSSWAAPMMMAMSPFAMGEAPAAAGGSEQARRPAIFF